MTQTYTDFHLHLLPGVDDGSSALQETLSMIKGLADLGFCTFVCTPHQKEGSINPSLASVREVYEVVAEEVQEIFPSVRLLLGAENFYDSQLSHRLDTHEVPTIAGSDLFLLEFPPTIEEKPFRTALFRIQTEGYIPILAHVERYEFLDEKILRDLADDVIMQVNLTSFSKDPQSPQQHARALRYIEKGFIRLLATDMHSVHMLPRIQDAMEWIRTHLGAAVLDQGLSLTPQKLLQDWVKIA